MLEIKNKIKFENNCWVGEVDASLFNSSEEARIKAVTDLASITTGKLGLTELTVEDLKNNQGIDYWNRRLKLYNKLLTESAGEPSTPFEFIPAITWEDDKDWSTEFFNTYMKYVGYYVPMSGGEVLTNLRNTQDFYIEEGAEEYEDYSRFKIIVGQVPWKVISHLRTHRAFSWLVESSRNKRYLQDVQFWYPSWWSANLMAEKVSDDRETVFKQIRNIQYLEMKPEEATMELSDRRLVKFAMAAWKQDKNAWDNLFAVRGNNTGTMNITGITVNNIKRIINGK